VQQELEPAADGQSRRGTDHRHARIAQRGRGLLEPGHHGIDRLGLAVGQRLAHLLQIGPDAERGLVLPQHQGARLGLGHPHRVQHALERLGADGVMRR